MLAASFQYRKGRTVMAQIQKGNIYDPKATETTRRRYQRNARFYDLMEGGIEKRHSPWRKE